MSVCWHTWDTNYISLRICHGNKICLGGKHPFNEIGTYSSNVWTNIKCLKYVIVLLMVVSLNLTCQITELECTIAGLLLSANPMYIYILFHSLLPFVSCK